MLSRTVDPVSSQPDVPLDPGPPLRHSYNSLFGDDDGAPEPDGSADPRASAGAEPAPLSYDDPPGDEQPYLPPAALDRPQPVASGDDAGWHGDPALAARAARPVDTGRLYHSAGAEVTEGTGAIPALPAPGHHERAAERSGVPQPQLPPPVATPSPDDAAGESTPRPAPAEAPARFEGVAPGKPAAGPPPASVAPTAVAASGLTYLGVITVVAVPTLLVGLAQALIWDRVGWLTGLVLVATSIYAALTVRRPDFSAAVVVPPLSFLLTILVAGQFTLAEGGSLLVREGFVIVRGLAENAPWILGATALAAVIVVVRARRRGR